MASVPVSGEKARPRARAGRLRPGRRLVAALRGVALFVGLFTALNLVGELRTPGFDQNVWWVDLRWLPKPLAVALLATSAAMFVAWGVKPGAGGRRRRATATVAAALAVAALVDVARFYQVWAADDIDPRVPLPLSALIALALGLVAWGAAGEPAPDAADPRRAQGPRIPSVAIVAGVLLALAVLFPLLQIVFFGTTDYRRPADAAVVFGAQVHPGGAPSKTLTWRVDTACALYRQGLVRYLVMSGGVGESGYDEAQVMRDMALRQGVPEGAVVVDSVGVNTTATVADTLGLARARGFTRLIAVSNAYHLPRIKLAFARQGRDILTVPAVETSRIAQTPYLWLREVPAFWVYYLRAVLR